jgi:hypothetical protein
MNGLHCGRMTAELEPSPRRWGLRETAAAVGVAAVIAAFGGAAIYAATEGRPDQLAASRAARAAPVALAGSTAPSAAPARPQWVQRPCMASS